MADPNDDTPTRSPIEEGGRYSRRIRGVEPMDPTVAPLTREGIDTEHMPDPVPGDRPENRGELSDTYRALKDEDEPRE